MGTTSIRFFFTGLVLDGENLCVVSRVLIQVLMLLCRLQQQLDECPEDCIVVRILQVHVAHIGAMTCAGVKDRAGGK